MEIFKMIRRILYVRRHRFILILAVFVCYAYHNLFQKLQNYFSYESESFNGSVTKENSNLSNGEILDGEQVKRKEIDQVSRIFDDIDTERTLQNKEVEEDTVALRLKERRQKFLEACKEETQGCFVQVVIANRIHFFSKHETSVCTISKVASSTWRDHLRRVNGLKSHVSIYNDKNRINILRRPLKDRLKYINSTSRIITVRHPLTRLVSAYLNKYNEGKLLGSRPTREKYFDKGKGHSWHSKFFKFWLPALAVNNMMPSDIHLKVGVDKPINQSVEYPVYVYERLYNILEPKVSFVQFLNLVIDSYKHGYADAHWKTYSDTCCPCRFDYEYITKVETLSEDLKYIFKKLSIPAKPETVINQSRSSVKDLYEHFKYYKNVPKTMKIELYKYIKRDMDLFGYTLPKNFFE